MIRRCERTAGFEVFAQLMESDWRLAHYDSVGYTEESVLYNS